MKRIKTDIKGFDELIEGGFPQGSTILLSGSAGTGKTIFSIEYLYNAIKNNKEKCIYFTFEEKKKSLIEQAKQFNWDLEKFEKGRKLKIVSIGIESITKEYIDEVFEIINNFNPTRIVIDSISTLSFLATQNYDINSKHAIRKFIYYFLAKFKEKDNITSIFISQKDIKLSNTIAEYLCDGVVSIEYESLGGEFSRNLTVKKMRKTKNNEDLHPLEISKDGIIVHSLE